ncbi:hypothetical protein FDECE_12599 [Fusarium decemcellulare]|nr:hypothetical protein FDECE_12599 [Fusarium decemcellulare]
MSDTPEAPEEKKAEKPYVEEYPDANDGRKKSSAEPRKRPPRRRRATETQADRPFRQHVLHGSFDDSYVNDLGGSRYMGPAGEIPPFQPFGDGGSFIPPYNLDAQPQSTEYPFSSYQATQIPSSLHAAVWTDHPNYQPPVGGLPGSPFPASFPPRGPYFPSNGQPQSAVGISSPDGYYPGNEYHPSSRPFPQYTGPSTRPPRPKAVPWTSGFAPELMPRKPKPVAVTRQHKKERQAPAKKKEEAVIHKESKRELDRLRRRVDSVEDKFVEELRRQYLKDAETGSTPERLLLDWVRSSSTFSRPVPHETRSWDERRPGDYDQILEEIIRFLDGKRSQGSRGSVRETLEDLRRNKLELERRTVSEPRADPDFRAEVEAIVWDILKHLRIEEAGDEGPSTRHPTQLSIRDRAESLRRSRGLSSIAPSTAHVAVASSSKRPESLRYALAQRSSKDAAQLYMQQKQKAEAYEKELSLTRPRAQRAYTDDATSTAPTLRSRLGEPSAYKKNGYVFIKGGRMEPVIQEEDDEEELDREADRLGLRRHRHHGNTPRHEEDFGPDEPEHMIPSRKQSRNPFASRTRSKSRPPPEVPDPPSYPS